MKRLAHTPRPPPFAPGLLLGLVMLVGPPGTAAQTGDPMKVLEEAAARYDALDAHCARFEQVRRVPLLKEVTESRGRLCQKDPDLFLMDFSDPEDDVIVSDGTHLWIYYPSVDAKQVFQQELTPGGGRFDFHREFLSDPGTRYEPSYAGREDVDGHAAHVLKLVPRQASPYKEALVWIDVRSGLIRRVEILEENDSIRQVALSDFDLDPELPRETFQFTPPPGAQVIRR